MLKFFVTVLFVASLVLTGCSSGTRYKAEDLAIPILQAVEDGDWEDLVELLPEEDDIDKVFASNQGLLGNTYYNKYTTEYRWESLKANIVTDLDATHYISELNNLDWDRVQYDNNIVTEEIYEGGIYTKCIVKLSFPEAGEGWQLEYNAVNVDGTWYLLDGIYFLNPVEV